MMNKQKTTRAYRWVWLLALPIVATMLWATNALTAQETNDKAEAKQQKQATAISGQTNNTHTDKAQKPKREKEETTPLALNLEAIEVNAYAMTEADKKAIQEAKIAIQEAEKAIQEAEKIATQEVEKVLKEAKKAIQEGQETVQQAEKELSNSEAEQPQKKSKKKADKQKDKGKQVEVDWPNTDAPKFIGDTPGLMEYLSKNIKYPEEAVKKKEQGRVIVQFDVDPQGQHSNYRVVRSVSPSLDAEATRVIKAMPNWIAAYDRKQKKHVSASFTLPVVFRLQ